ncbi:MAG: hypothetical protein RLY86_4321 [Pseudomonadota bacterium]|jgi:hypothetical protein
MTGHAPHLAPPLPFALSGGSLPAAVPMPAVNLAEVFARLDSALMSLLTGGPDAQMRQMLIVERLCALAREALAGDNAAGDILATIAGKAPVIAGLMLVPEGLREIAFSDSIRLLGSLRARLEGGHPLATAARAGEAV